MRTRRTASESKVAYRRRARMKVQGYVGAELRQQIQARCAEQGCSESAFVSAAIGEAIDGKITDARLVIDRLNRLDTKIAGVEDAIVLLTEVLQPLIMAFHASMDAGILEPPPKA